MKTIRSWFKMFTKNVARVDNEEFEKSMLLIKKNMSPSHIHLAGHLFYLENVHWELLERTPRKNKPEFALINNISTKEAFLASEGQVNWMKEYYIGWFTDTWTDKKSAVELIANRGGHFNDREATEEDLMKK